MTFSNAQGSYTSQGAFALRTVGKSVYFDSVNYVRDRANDLALKAFSIPNRLNMVVSGDVQGKLLEPYIPEVESFKGNVSFKLV